MPPAPIRSLPSAAIALLALSLATAAAAQSLRIEVFPVHQARAEELVPVLRPLVPEPGSVGAYQGQLVVRSTEANLAAVRAVLAKLDRAPHDLVITVRHGVRTRRELDASAGARVVTAGSRGDDQDHQTLRVLEGRPAFVSAGEEIPVAERRLHLGRGGIAVEDAVRYQRAATGFYVRARLTGDAREVQLDVAAERTRPSASDGGVFTTSSAYTTVSARLGEWVELGGNAGHAEREAHGAAWSAGSAEDVERRIFVKVELAR